MSDFGDDGEGKDVPAEDVEMAGEADEAGEDGNQAELPFADEGPDDSLPRVAFIDYLTSPVVTLIVGNRDNETILTAHQALLASSSYFEAACAEFQDDGSVRSPFRRKSPQRKLPPTDRMLSFAAPHH